MCSIYVFFSLSSFLSAASGTLPQVDGAVAGGWEQSSFLPTSHFPPPRGGEWDSITQVRVFLRRPTWVAVSRQFCICIADEKMSTFLILLASLAKRQLAASNLAFFNNIVFKCHLSHSLTIIVGEHCCPDIVCFFVWFFTFHLRVPGCCSVPYLHHLRSHLYLMLLFS